MSHCNFEISIYYPHNKCVKPFLFLPKQPTCWPMDSLRFGFVLLCVWCLWLPMEKTLVSINELVLH